MGETVERKFCLTVVPLGGGWRDVYVDTYREAVERGYLLALRPSCRYVNVNRLGRHGLYVGVATIAGLNGRVWLSRTSPLGEVAWKGKEPEPESKAVELTGKYAVPWEYSI